MPVRHGVITVYPLKYSCNDPEEAPYLVFWGFELKLAKELGLIKLRIGGVVKYGQKAAIFKKYMLFFFELKDKNKHNPAKKKSAKLLMNSLYGKTGQDDHGTTQLIPISDLDMLSLEDLEKPTSSEEGILRSL
jgi:hypothetical protein